MKHEELSEGEEIREVFTVLSSSRKGEGKEKPFPYIFCVSSIVFRWQWWWLGDLADGYLLYVLLSDSKLQRKNGDYIESRISPKLLQLCWNGQL